MRRLLKKIRNPHAALAAQHERSIDALGPRATEAHQVQFEENGEGGPTGPDVIQLLPPEVRRHLLSVLNLDQLRSLVRASPVFHEQYVHDRAYILCGLLDETLRTVVVDAFTVQRLSMSVRGTERDMPGFLRQAYAQPVMSLVGRATEDEAVSMTVFHSSVKAIIPLFMKWALGDDDVKPSCVEYMRLIRAVYRYQLFCLVADPVAGVGTRAKEAAVQTLVSLFEPWEVEELLSFLQYVEDVYEKTLQAVRWDLPHGLDDLHRDLVMPEDRDPEASPRDDYIAGLALRGLTLLRVVVSQGHDQLVMTVQENMVRSDIRLNPRNSRSVFSQAGQTVQRRHHPSERDRLTAERRLFPFRGDREPDSVLVAGSLPPIAWTMIWGGTYSNLYGFYTSDDLRRWGYVFWDQATMVEQRGERVLRVQWEQTWEGNDPRNMLEA